MEAFTFGRMNEFSFISSSASTLLSDERVSGRDFIPFKLFKLRLWGPAELPYGFGCL